MKEEQYDGITVDEAVVAEFFLPALSVCKTQEHDEVSFLSAIHLNDRVIYGLNPTWIKGFAVGSLGMNVSKAFFFQYSGLCARKWRRTRADHVPFYRRTSTKIT